MVKTQPAGEFLVSFLVDARGGYMQAQRMPQMKIFVPPDAAPSPTRIICHLLRPDHITNLPAMNDCDGFASRILQIHSSCARFQKPILIEMPYIALVSNEVRNIVIMRKGFDSETWKEHSALINDETLKEDFGSLYESITPYDKLESGRICRIITTDIPNYFSLISRFQRDINMIGPEGGHIESKVDKRIKLTFPQGALMKKIQISLEVQNVDPNIINHLVGDNHNISVSPIITVEPKRRKFRDLIEIQMGLPKGVTKADVPNLRLLFSISEYATKWEDVTNSTELTLIEDCIAHSTKISARVWLIFAPGIEDIADLANQIYARHCPTPYVGKFLAFARRHEQEECQLRCILITDDTADKTLECQESFDLIATGPEIEVINKLEYQIETAGNIVAVTKSDEPILFPVQSFIENRITLPMRIRNTEEPFSGKIAFIPNFKSVSKQIVKPITTLDINIPDYIVDMVGSFRNPDRKHRVKNASLDRIKGCQAIAKTELDLKSVADSIGSDWLNLSEELGCNSEDINLVLNENCTNEEKAFMALIQWQNNFGYKATGNELNRALRNIGREDVVKTCMGNITFVEDEEEVKSAMERLNGGDFQEEHDGCWDDVMSPDKPAEYNESIDESMIVETGDEWSQSHQEEKLSETSEDKSLVMETTPESENDPNAEIIPIVHMDRTVKLVDRTPSEKTAAFLLLIDQLDDCLPEPALQVTSVNQTNKTDVYEESLGKSTYKNKQVENVDKSISLLNLINCQISNDDVCVDTVMDLDQYFAEPQEIDIENFSQIDLNEYDEFRDQSECVLEVCIPENKSSLSLSNYEGCEITNTLMNMVKENNKNIPVENPRKETTFRRNAADKARLLKHNDKFHFHPPVSSLRRCYSVDSRHGRGISSICSHISNHQIESIIEMCDGTTEKDLKTIESISDYELPKVSIEPEKYILNDAEVHIVKENTIFDAIITPQKEPSYYFSNLVCESPVTDLDNLSSPEEMDKAIDSTEVEEEELCESKLEMSTIPSFMDYDFEREECEQTIPQMSSVSLSEENPNFTESQVDTEELKQSPKHSVLHEVYESDPQTQTEVEEETEVLPDGSIVIRKITRKNIVHTITEKITREMHPEDEELSHALICLENPTEITESEEVLPDGSIIKRTITTSKYNTSSSSKFITEKEFVEKNEIDSSEGIPIEKNEASNEPVSNKPIAKSRKNKNKNKKSSKK